MTDHYFTNNNITSNEKEIMVKIKGKEYKLISDRGVFSKDGLDIGTRVLLETIDLTRLHGRILDFGCGYGIIGLAVFKNTFNTIIDMVDVNERALKLARRNAKLNKANVNIFNSDIYSNVVEKYNFIITNPPIKAGKKILYEILMNAHDYLLDDGELWLVINKNHGAKSLIKNLELKYNVSVVDRKHNFYVICCLKR